MAFTVTTSGNANGATQVEHPDADNVNVEDGHLVLRAHRMIVGIYAPGRWHAVIDRELSNASRGRRAALVPNVSA